MPPDDRAELCATIADLARASGAGTRRRLIATCRDDLFGRVSALPELDRVLEENTYTVRGVDPNALVDIVTGPARDAGFELEDAAAVVAKAAEIVVPDPSALPLLQFALTQWWKARDEERQVLPARAWQQIGGIEGALARAAQQVHDSLSTDEQSLMRTMLVSMFRPDGTRARVPESNAASTAAARSVLEELIERRLVRRYSAASGDSTLEVAHEALANRWAPLAEWLEETRLERELIAEIETDAARWDRAGRHDDMLWRGVRLEGALDVRHKLTGAPREFIDAAGDLQARHRRRRRGIIAGVVILVVTAIVIGAFLAIVQSRLAAERERKRKAMEELEQLRSRPPAEAVKSRKARLDDVLDIDE
jgi:hypothetical protein